MVTQVKTAPDVRRTPAVLSRIGAAETLEEALGALGQGALALLGGTQAAVRAYAVDRQGTNLAFWVRPDGTLVPADYADPTPASVAGQLQAGGPARIVPDLWALDPSESPLYSQLREDGLRSSVAVPIVAGEERIGSLHVDHPEPDHFGELHLALAEALAIQAGSAIERARERSRSSREDELRRMYAEARDQTDTHVALNQALRQVAEEHELALEAAREALRARDEFLAVAAHELRTPTTTVSGLAQLMVRKVNRGREVSPEELRRWAGLVASQTARLARIVNHLVDCARIADGSLEITPSETDLVALVRAALPSLMLEPERQEVVLNVPAEPLVIQADAELLSGTVLTLLDNATKFSDRRLAANAPGGVSEDAPTAAVELTVRAVAGGVELTVQDWGIGIPDEHLPQLFDRFSRAHGAIQLSGIGLGLSIARHVVELHGGTIGATRPAGGGTLVRVWLPNGSEGPKRAAE